jgi:hypothetical protein
MIEGRGSTNGQTDEIVPGPCPPKGCPEPTEIVCIKVDKVFDACSQRECFEDVEFCFDGRCDEVECEVKKVLTDCELTQVQEDPPLVRADIEIEIVIKVTCNSFTDKRTLTVNKQVLLFGFEEMDCQVVAIAECLGCDVMGIDSRTRVLCDVGLFLEVKTTDFVQLLVPSFGFCPVPPECEKLPFIDRCEDFLEGPPPRRFFPQPFEFVDENDDS